MAKKVIWSSRSKLDLFEILDYWRERNRNTVYSEKLYRLFKAHLATLSKYPEAGKPTNVKDIRVKIAGSYLLFYKIINEEIHLITIWDGRQDPDKLSGILKKA